MHAHEHKREIEGMKKHYRKNTIHVVGVQKSGECRKYVREDASHLTDGRI